MDNDREPLLPEDPLSEQAQSPQAATTAASQSPPRKRRDTFTRLSFSASSGPPRAVNTTAVPGTVYSQDTHPTFTHDDQLDSSRANSLSSAGGFRDLRSYDPRALPSTRRGSYRRMSSTGDAPILGQRSSPSFAERWVHRQSMMSTSPSSSSAQQHPYKAQQQYDQLRSPSQQHPHYGSIPIITHTGGESAIDMDQFARDNASHSGGSHQNHDLADGDFHSKPSTRRNSESSSLDDVCFPLDVLDDIQGLRNWPDLSVLEEFYKEETDRLEGGAKREAQEANMTFDQFSDSASIRSAQVGFTYPIISKVDNPAISHQLHNAKINETETFNGRLRPPKINPFDRSSKQKTGNADFLKTINYPPHIINNNAEHFRFTYFREDLDSTVHSPTISGLLQPEQTFADLFDCKQYTKLPVSQVPTPQPTQTPLPSAPPQVPSNSSSTPARDATPALSETKASSMSEDFSPFWLDVLNPTEEEMKVISKAFQVHPLTTEDIFLGETREKVELFKEYYFVCFRSFDIVQERKKKHLKNKQSEETASSIKQTLWNRLFNKTAIHSTAAGSSMRSESSSKRRKRKQVEREEYQRKSGEKHMPKNDELEPLNVYIIVFRHAVLTFHFAPTPHPINVRRRARLLREYLTVSADWIAYALIDDITDAFGPMIESIEDEVNDIEDAILRMHPGNDSSDEESSESEEEYELDQKSLLRSRKGSTADTRSLKSFSSASTRSTASNVIEWKKKGDLLKRIGESRKRVMSLLRLLGSKVDVIKGFAKRCNEQWEVAPRSEIGMYLGDIQDHIVTMVQSLNHYEKLLARSHSNYLAQINIDMTKVNNDTNDVLGKISILGTVVLPMNIITGLWGMNVIVPGQEYDGLMWFWGIALGMFLFATCCFFYMKRISGLN